jgi:hypothetical protein
MKRYAIILVAIICLIVFVSGCLKSSETGQVEKIENHSNITGELNETKESSTGGVEENESTSKGNVDIR